MHFDPQLPEPYEGATKWVKADMLATVGFYRLEPLFREKGQDGKRRYIFPKVSDDDLAAIQECLMQALGLKKAA